MSNFSTMQDVRVRAVKSDGKGWMTIFTLFLGDNSFQGVTIVNLDASTVGLAIHLIRHRVSEHLGGRIVPSKEVSFVGKRSDSLSP